MGLCWLPILLAGVSLLTGCGSPSPQSFDRQQVTAELDALLDRAARNPDGEISRHALLTIDAPAVDFHYKGASGIGRIDTGEPMTPDRQFFIASVDKAMIAVVIYQMAEEGAFGAQGVDAKLASLGIFPPDAMAAIHRIDGVSYADEITLRHLLTHTSGMRDVLFDGADNPVSLMPGTTDGAAPDSVIGLMAFDQQYGLAQLVRCTLDGIPAGCNPDDYLFRYRWADWDYAAWQDNPDDKMAGLLNFYLAGMNENGLCKPGECFHYSDTNYILLAMVIEGMSGNSLNQEMRARIFDPLEMDNTYLLGATNPPAEPYEKNLSEVWAWGEPAISGGADLSFGGTSGIASTADDLHTFARALLSGKLFREVGTLDQMLAVPEDIQGISYASGLIVFPTSSGPVMYMMGSCGSWVEYYPPLDLTMVGTTDDCSNMPGQFQLHMQVFQVLASHGLPTPMAKLTSLPTTLAALSLACLMILAIVWLIAALLQRRRKDVVTPLVKWARWLTVAALLVNLVMFVLIGVTFGDNMFQMLFGFSSQIRSLLVITALLMGAFALVMAGLAVQLFRRGEGRRFDRWMLTTMAVAILVYAGSMGSLGL
jgi:CubicO group peptidase (beta-lactamase class C family)